MVTVMMKCLGAYVVLAPALQWNDRHVTPLRYTADDLSVLSYH